MVMIDTNDCDDENLKKLKIDTMTQLANDKEVADRKKYELYGFLKDKGDSPFTVRCKNCQRLTKLCYTHDTVAHIAAVKIAHETNHRRYAPIYHLLCLRL